MRDGCDMGGAFGLFQWWKVVYTATDGSVMSAVGVADDDVHATDEGVTVANDQKILYLDSH